MIWLWISTIVVLRGAELNAEIEHQTARALHQLRQLRNIRRNPSRFVFRQQISCGSASRLKFIIDIRKRVALLVPHDEAGAVVFDGPGRREAARGSCRETY